MTLLELFVAATNCNCWPVADSSFVAGGELAHLHLNALIVAALSATRDAAHTHTHTNS